MRQGWLAWITFARNQITEVIMEPSRRREARSSAAMEPLGNPTAEIAAAALTGLMAELEPTPNPDFEVVEAK